MRYLKYFKESIRSKYVELGVDDYYKKNKSEYKNPHSDRVIRSLDYVADKIDIGYFLDLACGDGVVTDYLKSKGLTDFKGSDPHFYEIYEEKFGVECDDSTFQDIANSGLNEKFDTIICSYALHLCPSSYFNNLLYQLASSCQNFVVISPSKYPVIDEDYFELVDNKIIDRTHIRIFKSKMTSIKEWREYKKPKSDYYTKRININKMELEDICNLLNIKDEPIFISSGRYGNAYKVGDKVVKVTTDLSEAKSVTSIIESGINNPSVVKYYSINRYKLKGSFVYVIVMDFVENLKDYLNKYKSKELYKEFISDCVNTLYSDIVNSTDDIVRRLTDLGWVGIGVKDNFWINRVWNLYNSITDENRINIKNIDIHIDNIGIKNGELVLFDYSKFDRINKFDDPKIIGNV